MTYTHSNELTQIFDLRKQNPPQALAVFMESLHDIPIVLYGAGAFGKENLALFRKFSVEPIAFLDRNAKENDVCMGVPVYTPDTEKFSLEFRKKCQVYISITLPKRIMESIKAALHSAGYENVAEVQTITARQVMFDGIEEENPPDSYFESQREKIERAFQLMEDAESKETYLSCIRGHMLRRYAGCVETDFPCQYFDAGVPLQKDFSNFVDCGAYNGDSLSQILEKQNRIKNYVAFEPIVENFSQLTKVVQKFESRIDAAWLYPCGVSDRTGIATFSVEASSSTMVENQEGEVLPIVRMDDTIKTAPVSFLKMDIEGAEIAALQGAVELIQKQSPDLAISVYHAANHFWDIPCLIEKINPNYKFYLRSHTPATLESVLYCTV